MSYLVIARKWRPQTFDEIVGQETAQLLGPQASFYSVNVTSRADVQAWIETVAAKFGRIDVLVNNAAFQMNNEDITQITDEDFDRTFKTNVYAMFWITRDALPHLPPGATIINSTSVQGYNPSPMIINYASTKFAIIGFTKALAADLAPRGIRVNAVAPGPVWTPLQVSDGQPAEKLDGFGDSSWLGRTSQPVEQAPAYVFLASPESSFVVGEVINVNGGANVP